MNLLGGQIVVIDFYSQIKTVASIFCFENIGNPC